MTSAVIKAATNTETALLAEMKKVSEAPAILVVDDEPLLRWHATDVLAANGYSILKADDAATALRILEERPDVRLLFTDIQMPGDMDGLALAARVHELWPRILLLVTSGNVMTADEAVPDDGRFLAKPYGEQQMVDQVADMIATGHREAGEA